MFIFKVAVLFAFSLLPVPVFANSNPQESTRDLGDQNATSKFLTFGEVDSWVLDAEANEILIVEVTTNQFDAVLGLAKGDGDKEEVLFSKDENGSNSRFRYRIKNAGRYKIRVHGYEMKGSGNYQLAVQRYCAKPLSIDKPLRSRSNDHGQANFFFDAEPGQFVTMVDSHIALFDPDGEIVQPHWMQGVYFIRKGGEYLAHAQGNAVDADFDFEVCSAVIRPLESGQTETMKLREGTLCNWEINAQRGQFELITVSRAQRPDSQLIFAPKIDPNEKQLNSQTDRGPELRFLPVASKGKATTYAVVFGRTGKYILQTFSRGQDSPLEVTMSDPTVDLSSKPELADRLNIGAAGWYGFEASPGDLVKLSLRSDSFDTVLRLFDGRGELKEENDDFEDSTNSEVSFLVPSDGYYRWQVCSLGNGGGGDYSIDFLEIPKTKISVGDVTQGKIQNGRTDYWSLEGKPDQLVIVNVRSRSFVPNVSVYSSRGRQISGNIQSPGSGSLIPLELDREGKATIWINTSGRDGKYDIRVVDAEWGAMPESSSVEVSQRIQRDK